MPPPSLTSLVLVENFDSSFNNHSGRDATGTAWGVVTVELFEMQGYGLSLKEFEERAE